MKSEALFEDNYIQLGFPDETSFYKVSEKWKDLSQNLILEIFDPFI